MLGVRACEILMFDLRSVSLVQLAWTGELWRGMGFEGGLGEKEG